MKFPEKPVPCTLSDRDWQTYCIQTWCLNSLNALRGKLRAAPGRVNAITVFELDKATAIINFLLEETGRVWKGERSK